MSMNPKECGRKLIDALLEREYDKAINLLKGNEVDFSLENKGDNAIHLAARSGKLKIIKRMRKAGCRLDQPNVHGNTALHYAARGGHIRVVKYLKKKRVFMDAQNYNGETPLDKAVTCQTMNIIEDLVELGMDPNARNEITGETPLFTAVRAGMQEAMEGLLIKGASPDIRNKEGQRAAEVALNASIRESLKMYRGLLIALGSDQIQAKGLKISRAQVTESLVIERVGVVLETFDIPKEFPTGFYCRRERAENATIALKTFEEESVFSDVFHIRIFEVNRACPAKIYLPLYQTPSEKEQMVLRFYKSELEDRTIDQFVVENQLPYCPFSETLVPETNYICIVYIHQKKEDTKISDEGGTITSEMEKDFALEIPAGSFQGETFLSLQVFESSEKVSEEQSTDAVPDEDLQPSATQGNISEGTDIAEQEAIETSQDESAYRSPNEVESSAASTDQSQDSSHPTKTEEKVPSSNLLTDVYQINVQGQQPKKGITMQIPLAKGMSPDDDIAIVTANEKSLSGDESLEVLPEKPRVVNCNLIFEVSHFSVFTASWRKDVETKEKRALLQRQISSARERRKPAAFFVMVKKDTEDENGWKHVIVVECNTAAKSRERMRRWLERDFKVQSPAQSENIMMTPGDNFFVSVSGNATMESENDAKVRKIQFSQCRPSFQAFRVNLQEGIFDEADAFGHVVITKKSDLDVYEEVAKLYIQLEPPPRPPPPTPPSEPSSRPDAAIDPSTPRSSQPTAKTSNRPESAAQQRVQAFIENRRALSSFLSIGT